MYGDNEPALVINVRENPLLSHNICNSLKIRRNLKRDSVKTITLFRLGKVKGVPSKAEHSQPCQILLKCLVYSATTDFLVF